MNIVRVRIPAGELVPQDVERVLNPLMVVNVGIGEKGALRISGKGELKISGAVESLEASRGINTRPSCGKFMKSSGNRMEPLMEASHKLKELVFNSGKQSRRFDLGDPFHTSKSLLAGVNLMGL